MRHRQSLFASLAVSLFFTALSIPTSGVNAADQAQTSEIVKALLGVTVEDLSRRDKTVATLIQAVEALEKERTAPNPPAGAKPADVDEALALLKTGDTQKAEAIFEAVLAQETAKGDDARDAAAQAATHIGTLASLHDAQKALTYFEKATQLAPDDAETWNNLGRTLLSVDDFQGASTAFKTILAFGDAVADKKTIATATGTLGIIAFITGDFDQAQAYYQRALPLFEALDDKFSIASTYGNLGVIAFNQDDLEKAESHFQRSLKIFAELENKSGVARTYGNLGNIAHARGDTAEACRRWHESQTLSQAVGLNQVAEDTQAMMTEANCPAQ